MKKTLTSIRCVPRFGYGHTQVRTVDVDLPADFDEAELQDVLNNWFEQRELHEAVYAVDVDDNGYFVIVNDEAYYDDWGNSLL